MFWVPHRDRPVPVFEDNSTAFETGTPAMQAAIAVAVIGITVFALMHLRLLLWNLAEYRRFAHTTAYGALHPGNAETKVLALPLTIAKTLNVGFIIGLVFVQGLWTLVEYLFPAAMVAFLLVDIWALRLLGPSMAACWSRAASTARATTASPRCCPPLPCRLSPWASPSPPR
jgi:hypothetical protein